MTATPLAQADGSGCTAFDVAMVSEWQYAQDKFRSLALCIGRVDVKVRRRPVCVSGCVVLPIGGLGVSWCCAAFLTSWQTLFKFSFKVMVCLH